MQEESPYNDFKQWYDDIPKFRLFPWRIFAEPIESDYEPKKSERKDLQIRHAILWLIQRCKWYEHTEGNQFEEFLRSQIQRLEDQKFEHVAEIKNKLSYDYQSIDDLYQDLFWLTENYLYTDPEFEQILKENYESYINTFKTFRS